MKTRIEEHKNFGKTLFIEHGDITLGVTVDIGPRVIYMSYKGCENLFYEDTERRTQKNDQTYRDKFGKDSAWYLYGGHRIWMSPEEYPATYDADNNPVDYTVDGETVTFAQKAHTGSTITATLKLVFENGGITVYNTIKNVTDKTINGAVWALSVMAPGGVGFVKLNDKDTGLLSNKKLVLWPYTKLTDKRLYLFDKYLAVKQDAAAGCDFKIATDNDSGVIHYYKDGTLFTKEFDIEKGAEYPDCGVYCEFFTGNYFFELESLSALHDIPANSELTHVERWSLSECGNLTEITEKNIENLLKITK